MNKQQSVPGTSKSMKEKRKLKIEQREYTFFETCAIICSFILAILTFPFSLLVCFKVIFEYKRLVIFRLGLLRSGGPRGPGLVFILPCIDEWFLVDLRLKTLDMYPQQVITKDSVGIRLELSTLRTVVGRKTLSELLLERENIMIAMREILIQGTSPWGVDIERVEIKDIRIPYELQKAFAAEAEANRRAKAKFIAALGEKTAAIELLVAGQILSSRPAAIQVRFREHP